MTNSWKKAVSGDWNTASNWTAGVPVYGSTALITLPGTYTVTSSQANAVGTLEMSSGATLSIASHEFDVTSGTGAGALAGKITIAGSATLGLGVTSTISTFTNTGTIADATLSPSTLAINGVVTLTGNGKITLTNGQILGGGTNDTLINGNSLSGNTISGNGQIGEGALNFVNGTKGVIAVSGFMLSVDTNTFSNSGLVKATGVGDLELLSDISQTATGKIEASAGFALIELKNDANVIGGTVSIANKDAELRVDSGTSLIDAATTITNEGTIYAYGGNLLIAGAVTNTSTGTLFAGAGNTLDISGTVTGGTAHVVGASQLDFGGPSSAKVTFDPSSPGILILRDATKFTGTVAGMAANPSASIDLENIPFGDGPKVSFNKSTGLLIVTDAVAGITDKIKISGPAGTFTATEAADTSTLITDPASSSHSVNVMSLGNDMTSTHTLTSFHLANDGNGGAPAGLPVSQATPVRQAATGGASGIALPSMPQLSQFIQATASFGKGVGLDASPLANLQGESGGGYQNFVAASHH